VNEIFFLGKFIWKKLAIKNIYIYIYIDIDIFYYLKMLKLESVFLVLKFCKNILECNLKYFGMWSEIYFGTQ